MSDEQARDEILGVLGVPTLAEAATKVRELTATTALISVAPDGRLVVARMTFRQLAQVISALENTTMAG